MKQQPPWVLIASLIAGGGLSAVGQAFSTALPANASLVANITAFLVAGAGLVVSYYQGVNSPAVKILADAPVVTTEGEKVGVNVSTTSTAPISAPLAPPKGT